MGNTQIQRPSGVNIGVNNPGEIVYVKGNEFIDGSIRFILNDGDTEVTFEERAIGVWNPTGLRLAASTLFLDRQLSISSVGISLQVNALGADTKFLLPCVQFDDLGSLTPQFQIVDELVTDFVVQPIFDTDTVSNSFSESVTVVFTRIVTKANLKTGSTAATEPVTFILSQGLATGGTVLSSINLPASQFPANSDVEVIFSPGIGVGSGDEITFGFFSEADFSLLGNSSGDMFISIDTQLIVFQNLSTVNGNAVGFVTSATGILISVSGVDVWTDIDDGGVGLIWDIASAPDKFSITNTNNGEITYDGLIDCGISVGGSIEAGAMAGMDGVQIGISVNGAAPTNHTITTGFVTPTQLDSITMPTAKITISPGDTLKLQFRNISKNSGVTFFQAKQSVF